MSCAGFSYRLAAAATLALAGGVPPATASRGYHGCPQLRTRTGNVTKVRTQYSCAYTRRKLRSLLGIRNVTFKRGDQRLAVIDTPLQG